MPARRPFVRLILIALLLGVGGPLTAQQSTVIAARVGAAEAMMDAMVAGNFALVVAKFDSTMKAAVSEGALQSGWTSIGTQIGKFVKRNPARTEAHNNFISVVVPCDFERGKLELNVTFNTAGEVAGLSLRPPAPPYTLPDYANPSAYTEKEITVGAGGDWPLPGTLSTPTGTGPFPAVVLVHGSGPNDRDETMGPNKTLKDVAVGLASRGVAVLRFDKRTLVYPAKASLQKQFTVKDESIDDALAAVALLRNESTIDKSQIYVLGHSLGGMLAPRIAAADPRIAGIISMAGVVRSLEQSILDQYQYLFGADGSITESEQKMIDEAKKTVADVGALTPEEAAKNRTIAGAPASYWFDLRGYDPAALAAKLPQRILVLQGERDYQVTVADFERWKAALASKPNAEFHLYPGLNHLFLPGTAKSLPAEYNIPGHVPIEVVRDIAAWISK
jgi:dienelactone hydrolase